MRNKIITILITVVVLIVIITQIDLKELRENAKYFFSFPIFLAFLLYLTSFLLRALRWSFLLSGDLSVPKAFHIVSIHTVSNNIFPFRSGELTFPYFSQALYGVPFKKALVALLSARLADLWSLAVLFLFSISILGLSQIIPHKFLISLILLSGLFLIAPLLFVSFVDLVAKVPLFSKKVADVRDEIQHFLKGRQLLMLLVISLSIWLVKFAAFHRIAKAYSSNGDPGYWKVAVASIISEIMAAAPIQTVAEFGMFEAGWTGSFMLMGMSRKAALTLGFSLHVTFLLFSFLLGIPAYIWALIKTGVEK